MKSLSVLLSVTGEAQGQQDGGVHLVTTGTLTPLAKGYKLEYQETQPEDGEVQNISLLMEKGRVMMTRKGLFATSMVFEKGRRFEGIYHTPYGDMDMAIYSTKVSCHLDHDQGDVHLQYQLDLQGQFAAMQDLRLHYVENTGGEPLS